VKKWQRCRGGLFGLLLLAGCAEEAETQKPEPPEPCAAFRNDLDTLADADKEYADIPAGADEVTTRYYIHAARLARLQRELAVEELVIRDFELLEETPLHYGNLGLSPVEAAEERAWAESKKKDVLARIEVVLQASDAAGLTLRDGKGGAVDAGRVLEATFWREVSAQAKAHQSACDGGSPDTAAIQRFLDDIHVIQVADGHGLIEHGRIELYLSMEAP
jgi:hypothetical protein